MRIPGKYLQNFHFQVQGNLEILVSMEFMTNFMQMYSSRWWSLPSIHWWISTCPPAYWELNYTVEKLLVYVGICASVWSMKLRYPSLLGSKYCFLHWWFFFCQLFACLTALCILDLPSEVMLGWHAFKVTSSKANFLHSMVHWSQGCWRRCTHVIMRIQFY